MQGLGPHQTESGNRAIQSLLEELSSQVALVITCRDGAYEAWSPRGMVRFRRLADGDRIRFETLEQLGEDPLASQDPTLLSTLEEELRVSGSADPNRCYFEPDQVSYPYAHERIAALFDSPLAPDLILSPRAYTCGIQPGQHGALDVVQSRAPLAFAGPGIRPGRVPLACRQVDIAPTLCHAMGFPKIDGRDGLGRPASTYLARQDGEVLYDILDPDSPRPERVYLINLDGMSHTELFHRIDNETDSIPNLRRLLSRAAIFEFGTIVNFPSITWPSHSTLLTGAWCGHHDIVNPTYYLRDRRETVSPQGQIVETEGFLGEGVETLYEAFRRVRGSFTAAINEPQSRGADHAAFERRVIGDRTRLRALTKGFTEKVSVRWMQDEGLSREALADARGMAQVAILFDDRSHPAPDLVVHEFAITDGAGHAFGPHSEGVREALDETDVRIGQVLEILEGRGVLEETLFVVTADHGMASQDTSLAANPAWHPHRIGMKAVTAEPMVWLRDLRVEVERANDRRTARVRVLDNDADPQGEHSPVSDVVVEVVDRPGRRIAEGKTNREGTLAFATPGDIPSERIAVTLRHPDFNPRHMTLEGESLGPDPRQLYR